jgi:hypothetical protein
MSRRIFVSLILAIHGAASLGCSGQSPLQPGASADGVASPDVVAAQAVPGSYELSFHVLRNGSLEPVSSLAVSSEELILMAQVEDSARVPAQAGAATFEYCSFKGLPPNDITRPDEAPKEACDAGLARWARLTTVKLDAGTCPGFGAGSACMNFGIVQIPRTVGFRFRYTGQGSGIASGVSAEINFTWTPAT